MARRAFGALLTTPNDAPLAQRVFAALADGEFHSGEALADRAGVTRSAVWKAIEQLRELDLEIEAITHRGYRLVHPCEALDAARITAAVPTCAVRVAWEIDSTNGALLAADAPTPGEFVALLAENQTGGRGRRGRAWRASLGGSLALSIATTYETLPRELPALTLVIGCCVLQALHDRGAREVSLKWPNDLWFGERKLGGILVELRAEAGGPGHVVIGIGLNLRLSIASRTAIESLGTSAADLLECGVDVAARNALAARVIARCVEGLKVFGNAGFAPFFAPWRATDALRGRRVRVGETGREIEGVARGIDAEGALLVENAIGERVRVIAGEVSVRPAGAA